MSLGLTLFWGQETKVDQTIDPWIHKMSWFHRNINKRLYVSHVSNSMGDTMDSGLKKSELGYCVICKHWKEISDLFALLGEKYRTLLKIMVMNLES